MLNLASSRHYVQKIIKAMAFLAMGFFIASAITQTAQAQGFDKAFQGFNSNNKAPVELEADNLEVLDGEAKAIFSGNVNVTQGKTVLKAKRIVVFYDKQASDSDEPAGNIKKMVIDSKVYVRSEDNVVTANSANVDMKSQLITLKGNVTLTQGGKNAATGDVLTVNLKTGKARLSSNKKKRIQMIFSPGSINKDKAN
jgi:lipopolysaccharide export system protein LptA